MRALLPAVTLISILVSSPARADQAAVVRTVTEAGLMGHRWSWDCGQPVGPDNRELHFDIAGNGVLAAYENNGSYVALFWLEAAHIAANGDVVVSRAVLQDLVGDAYEIVFRKTGEGLRIWSRVSLDGRIVVARDGAYADGTPTETWKRCA